MSLKGPDLSQTLRFGCSLKKYSVPLLTQTNLSFWRSFHKGVRKNPEVLTTTNNQSTMWINTSLHRWNVISCLFPSRFDEILCLTTLSCVGSTRLTQTIESKSHHPKKKWNTRRIGYNPTEKLDGITLREPHSTTCYLNPEQQTGEWAALGGERKGQE